MSYAGMVMLIGPTGCGKSTFRKKYLPKFPCVSPDDFVIGKRTDRKVSYAWQHARNMAIELLAEKQTFVADAQFLDPAVRAEWCKLARGFDFKVQACVFDISWEQIRKNQEKRGTRGFYGVIPLRVQRRSYQFMKQQLRSPEKLRAEFDSMDIVHFGKEELFDIVIDLGELK